MEYTHFMREISREDLQALKSAHALFEANGSGDEATKILVGRTAEIFGWDGKLANLRAKDLLWEIGLLLGKGISLSLQIFLRYATSVHEEDFIPVTARL